MMTDKELEQKSDDLMRLFFSFCDDAELDKYIDEEEALRQLNCLIESIITGNDTYTLENFKTDVEEAQREVEELCVIYLIVEIY